MELNKVINNQKKFIVELKSHILELQKSMGKKQSETKNVHTQTTRSFCHISTMTGEFIANGVDNKEGRSRSKNNSDSATQFEEQNTAAVAKKTSMTNCGNKGLMRHVAHRNKIMIIAGQHGRDTARFMKLHDT
ncbi:hypothetical protein JTB14_030026 [Gonioctena quinquepunctata]|nr:hypothetical protein JTB14_030026 [Gonioctena quinquepunctata]